MQPIYTVSCNATTSIDCQPDTQSNIYIYMVERGGGTYHLPLLVKPQEEWVSRHTSEKKPEIEQVPNLLMPIRLLRLKPDGKTQPLRPGCWLYIFQDGYLWREICLPNEASNFPFQMDVNLSKQAGKNQRPAECVSTFDFALPYRVNDYCPEYRLAFSEIQWSWSQIQALGGMHPEDPRNLEGEDLQTATTLAALEQRTGLIPLTDADIKASQIHVLNGPSQPLPNAESQFKDSEELTLPHLLISDPLQDARELKEKQDALIALQNAGLQSMQTGQLGLAQMIQELTAKGDPLALEEHLNPERYDQQLLDTWDSISEQLPERLEAAEEALIAYLQQEAFTLSISDYLQADDLLTNELGLTLFTQLIQHLVMPASLDWLYDLLDDQQKDQHPVYGVARGEKEALNRQLVFRASAGEEGLPTEDEERLQGLELPDRLALIGLLPTTLNELISKYAETVSHQQGRTLDQRMQGIAARFEKFTGLEIKLQSVYLRQWLPEPGMPASGPYRHLPPNLIQATHNLGKHQVRQLLPKDESFDSLIRKLDSNKNWQVGMTATLGILMGLNTVFAVAKAWEVRSTENTMAATAATTSFVGFALKKAQHWVPQPVEVKTQSMKNLATGQKEYLSLGQRVYRLVHQLIFKVLLRFMVVTASVLEVGLGAWRALRGYRTGNTGVMVACSMEALGATLLIASALIAGSEVLLAASPIHPWFLLAAGLGLVVAGAITLVFSEHTPLQQRIRHGWFGSHPYQRNDLSFQQPEGFDLEDQPAYFFRLALIQASEEGPLAQDLFNQPDLSGELTELTKPFFEFKAEIKVYELHDQTTINQVFSRADEILVEMEITPGTFTPVQTRLDGYLDLGGLRIALSDCYVIENRATGDYKEGQIRPLTKLRFLTQTTRTAIFQGITATVWLDPDGTGQLQVPEEPHAQRWRYRRNTHARIPPSEWQRLKSLAVQSPDGELETGVLVDEPEGCQLRPRHQARIRPFFAPGAC